MSGVSVPSTWSSWTGAEVCDTGIVPPSSTVAAVGRARPDVEEEVALEEEPRPHLDPASLWIGSASSSSFIVTTTPASRRPPARPPRPCPRPRRRSARPGPCGSAARSRRRALSSYGFVNGMSFGSAEEDRDHDHDERDQADLERGEAAAVLAQRLMAAPVWPSSACPGCRAGSRSPSPARVALVARLALAASGPGAAVFGYGFTCRWLSTCGPFAGAFDGTALVVRADLERDAVGGRRDGHEALAVAVRVALGEQARRVAEAERRVVAGRSARASGSGASGAASATAA